MSKPFVAAQVLSVHHPLLHTRVKECGNLFRFETHVETKTATNNGIGLRVSCLCPEGHGVARRAWTGWLEPYMGRYDLVVADLATPVITEDANQNDSIESPVISIRPLSLVQAA